MVALCDDSTFAPVSNFLNYIVRVGEGEGEETVLIEFNTLSYDICGGLALIIANWKLCLLWYLLLIIVSLGID